MKTKLGKIQYFIGAFLILLPFVVYCHVEMLSARSKAFFSHDNGYIADFFLYHKTCFLLATAGMIMLYAMVKFLTTESKKREKTLSKMPRSVQIFLAGTAICILVSALRACINKQSDDIWLGICTEREGVFTLLAYLVLFAATFIYFQTKEQQKFLKNCLLMLSVLVAAGSVVEYFVGPIYEIPFMKYIIAPERYRSIAESLSNEAYKSQVALGCYNSGYLGGLCALLFPIAFGAAYESESIKGWIGHGFLCAGLVFALVVSASTGALYATVVSIGLLCVLFRREPKKLFSTIGMIALCAVIGFCVGNIATGGRLSDRLYQTVVHPNTVETSEELFEIETMKLEDGVLKVYSKDAMFSVRCGDSKQSGLQELEIRNEEGKVLNSVIEDGVLSLTDSAYRAVKFQYRNEILYLNLGYEEDVLFYIEEQKICLVGQNGVSLDSIPQPAITGFEKYYGFATGRGYTWIQSLPILKDCLVIGKGAGNFVFEFQQNEVAGLLNTHGSSQFVVDKPHNWYLQMAVHNGLPSVILFVVLFIVLMKSSVKKYVINKPQAKSSVFAPTTVIAVTAFAITGLVNDSIVSVNPIFWIVFGLACAMVFEKTD